MTGADFRLISAKLSSVVKCTRSETSAVSLSHLPPIRLPPFDGNYDEWEQFRDRFTALIRENKDLDDFTRMHFLSSSLKGRALECIANISITAANFDIAWKTLTMRYENKRRSLNVHLTTLLNLADIKRESAPELQILYDRVNVAVSSLMNLNRTPEELWSDILVHIVAHKFDPITLKAWNLKECDREVPPSYEDLSRFIKSRVRALENCTPVSLVKPTAKTAAASRIHAATASTKPPAKCPLCQAQHFFSSCPKFVGGTPSQRQSIVKQYKRCFNCLSDKHSAPECQSKYSCRVCHRKHHLMLHLDSDSSLSSAGALSSNCSPPLSPQAQTKVNSLFASRAARRQSQVLLATAWITVQQSGRTAIVRALLDQGSEMTFISESLVQTLRAKRLRMPISVTAVGGIHAGTFRHATHILVSPRTALAPAFATTALILGNLTSYTPKRQTDLSALSHFTDLTWADPTSSDPIQVIIGADLYNDIIFDGVRKGGVGQPVAQNSVLGWVISGPINSKATNARTSATMQSVHSSPSNVSTHHISCTPSLEEELRRFWEIEEIPRQATLTPQEILCEEHFCSTHSRDSDGRYVVRLPFKKGPPIDIGASKFRAEKLLSTLFRRFQSDPSFADEYCAFISEYERLGHMCPVSESQSDTNQHVYIPHHGVTRASSTTTHLRVVFNASSRTSNGTSLNDHMYAGPKLQTEITSVILRWRKYPYVYSADIAKMYRQIRLDPRDLDYQKILWRNSPRTAIIIYKLLTVTYGMVCAPFLALRVLKQLVKDEGHRFPLAVSILRDNIYDDDLLFGANDPIILRQTRSQLTSLLKCGGFQLRKWASNVSSLLTDIDAGDHGLACSKQLAQDEQLKILGIRWKPASDTFEFQVSLENVVPSSKRSILSTIAKFYDPLGWITPVTIKAKIFMQYLWRETINWDDQISATLQDRCRKIYDQLSHIDQLRIPRWINLEPDIRSAELHGFSDASNVAYAAVVYLKVVSSTDQVTLSLLAGKSKVAPLKPLSIPRLELCAALLLARLTNFVRKSLDCENIPCYCWTDSTIVLTWVTQHPSRWKTFVANRVTEIQSQLPHGEWRHIRTEENPADCASRGLFAEELIEHKLWWHGPPWLHFASESWSQDNRTPPRDAPLEEKIIALF